MHTTFRLRVNILFILILLFAGFLGVRLYFVQIASGEEYKDLADRQYVRPNQNLFERGSIFFTTKDGDKVPAATIKRGFTVAIIPSALVEPERAYAELAEIIEVDRTDFMARAAKKDDPYEEIAKRVEKETAERIEALDIDGLRIFRERWRYYPGGDMAAHALGFVGFNDGKLAGQYGLEHQYEGTLAREQSGAYVNFFAEIFSNIKTVFRGEEEGNVVTTIEPSVEAFLQDELESLSVKWESDYSGGVIMNPQTGAIYALAASPAYDPNRFNEVSDAGVFTNPLVESVYEMGSVVKPLTVAAGLDSDVITPETHYEDKGYLVLNTERISNYDGEGRGWVPMQEILNQSLNTGVAFIADKMGNKSFGDYMEGYGLLEKTGIDLPNETENLTSNLKSSRKIEIATASYGQGIALTPISITRALATLGNGGYLVQPHIATDIEYEFGGSKHVAPDPDDRERVLKAGTSEEISRMLVTVVDDALAGGAEALPRYSIAAKTGTAQVANENGGGYYDDRFLHSFFGYFPAYDPQFIVFLYTMYPKEGARYASETLTDPFFEIAKFLINYYEIPPDR